MLVYNPAKRISAKAFLKDNNFNGVDRSKFPTGNFDGTFRCPALLCRMVSEIVIVSQWSKFRSRDKLLDSYPHTLHVGIRICD
ncbi:unnamed protein product [Gongylonema pulchrum]|uniref:Reverse transcriptase n=1 Tax=Gongylonema pulchrum TaxID=637853 RepID=A0A183EJV6_9BILA|nr:unnamed protein product [Gongylonema pulchrum]